MTYFYKGEFVDDDPNDPDEVYVYLSGDRRDGGCMVVSIFDTYKHFKFYETKSNICCDMLPGNACSDTSYYVKLCLYINRYCNELLRYDQEAFTNLVNTIKETYGDYKCMCDNLGNKFKGGFNTKSAK